MSIWREREDTSRVFDMQFVVSARLGAARSSILDAEVAVLRG